MDDPVPEDHLYEIEPAGFTAARNALVKQLKAEKRREDAARVASLRRPSPGAWALNQLARRSPEVVDRVLASGEALRRALEAASAGGAAAPTTREALRQMQTEVNGAVDQAERVLAESGAKTDATARERMWSTLQAAMAAGEVREALTAGRLDKDWPAPGFDLTSGSGSTRPRREPDTKEPDTKGRRGSRRGVRVRESPVADTAPSGTSEDGAKPEDGTLIVGSTLEARRAEKARRSEEAARKAAATRDAEVARVRRREQDAEVARLQKHAVELAQRADAAERTARERRAEADAAAAAAVEAGAALDGPRDGSS